VTRAQDEEAEGVGGDAESLPRKSRKKRGRSCLKCRQLRIKCDDERPCQSCRKRGETCEADDENISCHHCRKSKVKCDKQRPCSRCVAKGKPEECVSQLPVLVPEKPLANCQTFDEAGEDEQGVDLQEVEVGDEPNRKREFVEMGNEEQQGMEDDASTQKEGAHASTQNEGALQVVRPLRQQKRICLTDVSSARRAIHSSIRSKAMLRIWDAGYSKASLDNLFNSLPPGLEDAMNQGLRALDTLGWIREQTAKLRSAPMNGFTTPETSCTTPRRQSMEVANFDSMKLNQEFDSLGCGWWSLSFDPATGRRTHLECNSLLGDIVNTHWEELLGRAGHSDVEFPCSQLEFFCTILADLCSSSEKHLVRYNTSTPKRNGKIMDTLLLRRETFRTFNDEGKIVRVQHVVTRVTEEEYDAAYRSDPSICRPFSSVLGDYRTASEIVAETPRDILFDGQFARMAQTAEGAKKLKRLEACLRLRFEPIIQHAENESRKFAAAVGNAVTAAADGPAVDFGHRHITRTATDPVIEPQSLPQPRA